jgi:hypothetical protein
MRTCLLNCALSYMPTMHENARTGAQRAQQLQAVEALPEQGGAPHTHVGKSQSVGGRLWNALSGDDGAPPRPHVCARALVIGTGGHPATTTPCFGGPMGSILARHSQRLQPPSPHAHSRSY